MATRVETENARRHEEAPMSTSVHGTIRHAPSSARPATTAEPNAASGGPLAMVVRRQTVRWALLAAIAVLLVLSTLGQMAQRVFGLGTMFGLVRLFYVDAERNVPTFYSSLALLLACGLLAIVAAERRRCGDRLWIHWSWLSVLFLLLAADEFIGFHEMPIERLRRLWDAHGLLYFTWVVPGAAFVLLVAIASARWLLTLPRAVRNRYVVAATVFVTGAIGVEMLSGWVAEYRGEDTGIYAAVVTVEEACEMLGVWIFIDATLHFLERLGTSVTITFDHQPRSTDGRGVDRWADLADASARLNAPCAQQRPAQPVATRNGR
ncbi:MAG: hypothetical protein D6725_10600 [Planctomycetota bacterium]|nr:MAG: hypothetical protein D6725_10600 [Planctomycetota bacterium]